MKIKIDTVNKTIEIEEATTKELKKLCKDYEGFTIKSKGSEWHYPYYPWPTYWQPYTPLITEPYYITSVDCVTTGDMITDVTYKTDVPYTLTATVSN